MCNTRFIVQRHDRPRGRRSGVDIDPGSLRRAREQAGLSLAQVAGAELSRQAVHLIETGRMRPSNQTLEIIARRLGRPAAEFRAAGSWLAGADSRLAHLDQLCHAHQYDQAWRQAEQLLGEGGGGRLGALGHFYAGQALHHLNRQGEAAQHLLRAEELATTLQDPWLAAESMDWRALSLLHSSDCDALWVAEEALRRYRALEPRRPEVEARMLEHVGTCLTRRREFDRALGFYRDALHTLAAQATVRDLEGMARIYHGLAGCAWATGDLRRATELMQRAVALYSVEHELRPVAARLSLPRAENDLAVLLLDQGQLERADEQLESARSHAVKAGAGQALGHVLLTTGQLRQAQGRLDEAFAVVEEALRLCDDLGDRGTLAVGHQQLGELHAARAEDDEADACFARALTILDAAGLTERRARCQAAHERLLRARARADEERSAS